MFKVTLKLLLALIILFGCSGKQPESSWTAEEYFKYAMEKFNDEDYFEAVNDFTVVILRYAGSSVADSAQYYLGLSHYNMDEQLIAAAEFTKLINNMPQSPLVADAQYMLGESYYQMSPRASLDQEFTLKSIKEFQVFLEEFPLHEKKEEVEKKLHIAREKLAEKQLLNAELYRKMRKYSSSIIYYDIILEQYYDTDFADDALYGKATALLEMEEYQKAKTELLVFKDKFPDSELKDKVDKKLAQVVEKTDL